jgi:hypothetical protein
MDVEQDQIRLIALYNVAGFLQGCSGDYYIASVLKELRQCQKVLALRLDDQNSFSHIRERDSLAPGQVESVLPNRLYKSRRQFRLTDL